jgi:hypothetical protein
MHCACVACLQDARQRCDDEAGPAADLEAGGGLKLRREVRRARRHCGHGHTGPHALVSAALRQHAERPPRRTSPGQTGASSPLVAGVPVSLRPRTSAGSYTFAWKHVSLMSAWGAGAAGGARADMQVVGAPAAWFQRVTSASLLLSVRVHMQLQQCSKRTRGGQEECRRRDCRVKSH